MNNQSYWEESKQEAFDVLGAGDFGQFTRHYTNNTPKIFQFPNKIIVRLAEANSVFSRLKQAKNKLLGLYDAKLLKEIIKIGLAMDSWNRPGPSASSATYAQLMKISADKDDITVDINLGYIHFGHVLPMDSIKSPVNPQNGISFLPKETKPNHGWVCISRSGVVTRLTTNDMVIATPFTNGKKTSITGKVIFQEGSPSNNWMDQLQKVRRSEKNLHNPRFFQQTAN